MKVLKMVKIKHIVILTVVLLSFFLVHIAQAVTTEPGSDTNPLVSQDYVDAKISELAAKIAGLTGGGTTDPTKTVTTDSKITELTNTVNSLNQQIQDLKKVQTPKFEVIELEAGKQIVAGASTEFILRGGKAAAVGSASGGLSDLISGLDIQTGNNVPLNHLILVPRDDGRGIKATIKCWVMIKGEYKIK